MKVKNEQKTPEVGTVLRVKYPHRAEVAIIRFNPDVAKHPDLYSQKVVAAISEQLPETEMKNLFLTEWRRNSALQKSVFAGKVDILEKALQVVYDRVQQAGITITWETAGATTP